MAAQAVPTQHDAASREILSRFQQLLHKDPYLLDGETNLLHIATIKGQSSIVQEMLNINPRLARSTDSQNSTALHIAAELGNLEITRILVRVAPEMCWWRNSQGMNPIHVAAVNGHVEIRQELIVLDRLPSMEKVDRGQTVLHLCVKHRQLKALEFLVEKLDDAFIETKNDDGQTLFHLAAQCKDIEMIKLLAKKTKIVLVSRDSMGRTAMDMLKGKPRDTTASYPELRRHLHRGLSSEPRLNILHKMRETSMVVLVLIATMAFQAVVSPPGGLWQDDSSTHNAGEAVMAYAYPHIYPSFIITNSAAFLLSLIAICLLIMGSDPRDNLISLATSALAMMSIFMIAVSYGASVVVISPDIQVYSVYPVIKVVVTVAMGLNLFVIIATVLREDNRIVLIDKLKIRMRKLFEHRRQ